MPFTDNPTPLSPAEIKQLRIGLSALPPGDIGRVVVELMLETGIHAISAGDPARFNVTLTDDGYLDWDRAKNRHPMHNPVSPELRPWLAGLLDEFRQRPMQPTAVNMLVHRTCAKFGLGWVGPNRLRHTFGQMVQDRWHDAVITARLLGHNSLRDVMVYVNREEIPQKREIVEKGWWA